MDVAHQGTREKLSITGIVIFSIGINNLQDDTKSYMHTQNLAFISCN